MNATIKLAAYGVILVAMFGLGAALGAAVGPIDVGDHDDGANHRTHPLAPAHGLGAERPEQP